MFATVFRIGGYQQPQSCLDFHIPAFAQQPRTPVGHSRAVAPALVAVFGNSLPSHIVTGTHGIHADKAARIGLPEPVACAGFQQKVLDFPRIAEILGIIGKTQVQRPVGTQHHAALGIESGSGQFKRIGLYRIELCPQMGCQTACKQQEKGQ